MTKNYGIVLTSRRATKIVSAIVAAIVLTAATKPGPDRPASLQHSAVSAANAAAATPVAVVDAFHAALAKGDTRAALDLLAEDVQIFESGGVERSRAEYANHHLAADAAYSAAVRRTPINRAHGETGTVAWVTSVETVAGTYRGRAINSRGVETMLLRKATGQGRIAHIHWSSKDLAPK